MDECAQVSTQETPLKPSLLSYLQDTIRREERRRRRWAAARWGLLVAFALLACQWPHPRSDAAGTIAAAADGPTSRLAAFVCPELESVIAERTVEPPATLPRLAFAGPLPL